MLKPIKKLIPLILSTIFFLLLNSCTSYQVSESNLVIYDNSVLMSKPYDMLTNNILRIEIGQAEATTQKSSQVIKKTTVDRILEIVRTSYPNADSILIVSLESLIVSERDMFFGGVTNRYTYVANVIPIKFR